MKVHVISLGCPRNRVDTEMMLGHLVGAGHTVTPDPGQAHCVLINTCSFTQPATEESIDVIREMAEWKKQDPADRRLVVAGCLPERYPKELATRLPEVDAFLGTGAFEQVTEVIRDAPSPKRLIATPPEQRPIRGRCVDRARIAPLHSVYLKIAEGCSDHCTYCIIPKLRGPQRSRPLDEVVAEAQVLVETGARELILVAQNTAAYGRDLGEGYGLETLLEHLATMSEAMPELTWIRVLYGHPDYITERLLETVAHHSCICPYFDIPIQHISEPILKRMGRGHDSTAIAVLFERIRTKVPDAALRTTLMVGFPGETEADFERLLEFLDTVRFDHVGAFMYSDAPDLPSSRLADQVSESVKKDRFNRLMARQARISRQNNRKYVGQTLDAMVDAIVSSNPARIAARAAFQAPDIDGVIYAHNATIAPGTLVRVLIREADHYDLAGELV
ncbi:MAG: 30S ribosomal protein S12 methylthiotransferase RimO [Deltaproteobacteria bacterium]|nr:30S ribosomal protein S12 methylthiotransferase RimO [Deltaproteobacteria bacterium]